VPQDVFLFSDSIANNIAFGEEYGQSSRERINEAAEMAAFPEDFELFKDGFNTIIGERGITLSGGQKQRISIARALIKNPDILLLDDCLSALDTHTESKILKNLKHILGDKTGIIISHRVSSVGNAKNILILEDGKMLEYGTKISLENQASKFAEMLKNQLKN
jgi:ATP-binding cassette subfamily B multidrug efflux pump